MPPNATFTTKGKTMLPMVDGIQASKILSIIKEKLTATNTIVAALEADFVIYIPINHAVADMQMQASTNPVVDNTAAVITATHTVSNSKSRTLNREHNGRILLSQIEPRTRTQHRGTRTRLRLLLRLVA